MKRTVILILAAALLTGCIEDPTPERARVVINGEPGKSVRIIVATDFVAAVNQEGQTRVVILRADTVTATLPYDKTFNIEASQQIFAEVARADADVANLRMQVYIDSDVRFDEGGLLRDQPFRFVYAFNRPTTRDIAVVI